MQRDESLTKVTKEQFISAGYGATKKKEVQRFIEKVISKYVLIQVISHPAECHTRYCTQFKIV